MSCPPVLVQKHSFDIDVAVDSIYLLTVGPAIEIVTTCATKFTREAIAGPDSDNVIGHS